MKSILTRVAFVALCVVMLGQYASVAQAKPNEHSDYPGPDTTGGNSGGWIDDVVDEVADIFDDIGDGLEDIGDVVKQAWNCGGLLALVGVSCGAEVAACLETSGATCLGQAILRSSMCATLAERFKEECL